MKNHHSFGQIFLAVTLLGASACKTVNHDKDSKISSQESPDGSQLDLFDVNDVSILVPSPDPDQKDVSGYIRLVDQSQEGPILTKEMFQKSFDLIESFANKATYEDYAMAGLRIDNCSKLFAAQPCQVQLRMVFQPLVWVALAEGGRRKLFDDEAIHVAFNIKPTEVEGFYRDFYNLKKSALPRSTRGALGVHPILQEEGMNGVFGRKIKELVLKYSLPSNYERLAVMNLVGVGNGGNWSFAATLPIKDGKIEASPIPCQTEKVNAFVVMAGKMMSVPENKCGDLDASQLIAMPNVQAATLSKLEKEKLIENALRINDPTKVFFGSTTCVSCHVASRRIVSVMGADYLTENDKNPLRYQIPLDVTSDPTNVTKDNGDWGIRAFGWGDTGLRIGITLYTLNDTMRVAHELNNMVRSGKIK